MDGSGDYFEVIDFPVFNVADIYVSISVIVIVLLLIFHYKDGEFKVYHRMYDICELTVVSDHNTVGFFVMRSKVKVK